MPPRRSIFLDHFFRVLPSQVFDDLRPSFEPLADIEHRCTKTVAGDSWEGFYLYSKCGLYFELMRAAGDRRPDAFGMAFSEFDQRLDTRDYLVKTFQDRTWVPIQVARENGEAWFNGAFLEQPRKQVALWVAEYQGLNNRARKNYPKTRARGLSSIESLSVHARESLFVALPHLLKWSAMKVVKRSSHVLLLDLMRPDRGTFRMEVRNSGRRSDPSFELIARLARGAKFPAVERSGFRMLQSGRALELAWDAAATARDLLVSAAPGA